MLVKALQARGTVVRIMSFSQLARNVIGRKIGKESQRILIYTSLMAPFVAVLKLLKPSIPVVYMVRGDEISFVQRHGRRLRARVALWFQKLLARLGCHFVFVCEDLLALFEERMGKITNASVLPNTLGKPVPAVRPFDGRVGLIGHFDSVKNIEWAIQNLSGGRFEVHLFGNYTYPEEWHRPWLQSHGFVQDLRSQLRDKCSLVVLSYVDAGFPNVVLDALEAGCGVVVHDRFPFKYLPVHEAWRFSLASKMLSQQQEAGMPSDLECTLGRLLREKRDFKNDNNVLIELVESDWEQRVWEILS